MELGEGSIDSFSIQSPLHEWEDISTQLGTGGDRGTLLQDGRSTLPTPALRAQERDLVPWVAHSQVPLFPGLSFPLIPLPFHSSTPGRGSSPRPQEHLAEQRPVSPIRQQQQLPWRKPVVGGALLSPPDAKNEALSTSSRTGLFGHLWSAGPRLFLWSNKQRGQHWITESIADLLWQNWEHLTEK